jgi:two-component system response regulator MtrA
MPKRILVVEDDDVVRELVRMTLERQGYVVDAAEDGIEGYDLAVQNRPDLIVADIQMPAADGIHLIRRVRDTAELARTPVVIVSGTGFGNAAYTLSQGADAYEPKPIDPASLVSTVRRLLSDRGAAGDNAPDTETGKGA